MYIYFASSLQTLDFDGVPPLSFENYLGDCQRHLSDEDYDLVCAVSDEKDAIATSREGIQRLIEFNNGFRNDLVYFRAERAHKNPLDHMRGPPTANPYYIEIIQQAAAEANLLDAQKVIDQFKWKMWDDLSSSYHFGIELIVVYGLKIRMLETYQQTRSAKGSEVFEKLTNPEFLVEYLYQSPL